jgi:hypothetical protein
MHLFSRTAVLLAFAVSLTAGMQAQSTSDPQQPAPPAASAPAQPSSVQARIRARREQRRATAIQEVYNHLYEVYGGVGYLRFKAGPGAVAGAGLQKLNEYSYDVGVTRYFNEKLGVTIDGRGMYGTAYIGNNAYNVNHPAISEYAAMGGPTYRFLLHPRYSISGRVLGGVVIGNFSGDTDGFGSALLGLYPDSTAAAISASVPLEYNMSPALGLRVAPEYMLTTFGSTIQNNLGFTAGVVYRFGKQ